MVELFQVEVGKGRKSKSIYPKENVQLVTTKDDMIPSGIYFKLLNMP